jgi:ribosomal protein S27E
VSRGVATGGGPTATRSSLAKGRKFQAEGESEIIGLSAWLTSKRRLTRFQLTARAWGRRREGGHIIPEGLVVMGMVREGDQARLPMELPERTRRRRRLRRAIRRQREAKPPALMRAPLMQTCGFCGNRQAVFEDATICQRCGGILIRDSESS